MPTRQRAGDQPQQGGLADAVSPHQTDPVAGADIGLRLIQQDTRADAVGELVDPQHGVRFITAAKFMESRSAPGEGEWAGEIPRK